MANPQLDNGFLQLATEILEAFACFDFTARQRAVIDAILRCTWCIPEKNPDGSVNRDADDHVIKLKSAWISLSKISRLTGIAERHVSAVLRELLQKRVITRSYPGRASHPHFGFQKDYDLWQIPTRTSCRGEATAQTPAPHTPTSGSLPLVGVPADGSATTPSTGILTPADGSQTTPPTGDIKQKNRRTRLNRGKDTAAAAFPKPPSDHQTAVDFWCSEYKAATGLKYAFDRGKDGKIIKVLLNAFSLHDLKQIMLELIHTEDPWLRDRRGILMSTLKSECNALAQKALLDTRRPTRSDAARHNLSVIKNLITPGGDNGNQS